MAGAGALGVLALAAAGCANPGPPRAPSLRLPAPVRGLTAERVGDHVTLRFAVSQRTTDNLPVREAELRLKVCRAAEHGPCEPVGGAPELVPVKTTAGTANQVTVDDALPVGLTIGPPRLLAYTVELSNARGRTAGPSDAAYAVSGASPGPVSGLRVQGSRLGALLSWDAAPPDSGTLYVRRQGGAKDQGRTKQGGVLLRFDPANTARGQRLLDTGAEEDVAYRYSAFRERRITLGGRTLTLRSAESAPVAFTLRDVFPPPAPTELSAAPSVPDPDAPGRAYSVDLVWQPVEDPELSGYNVYREPLAGGAREKLNREPVGLPGFHDATAQPGVGYRWTVTAVDHKGNESAGATVTTGAH